MKHLIFVLGALLPVWLTATTVVAASQPAHLRLGHASPDTAAVDVLIDDQLVFEAVAFKELTTYLSLEPGVHQLKLVPAGAKAPALLTTRLTLKPGQAYTALAAGKAALLEPFILEDNFTPPTAGQARVRFVHVSPNAPEIDILLKNGSSLANNISFKSGGRYLAVRAGAYDLEMRVAGTSVVALDVPEVKLAEGQVYTLLVMGLAGGLPALELVSQIDNSPTPPPSVALEAAKDVEPADETGEADLPPANMPVTGAAEDRLVQRVLLALGLILLISVVGMGLRAAWR